jgi:hypothetical protein
LDAKAEQRPAWITHSITTVFISAARSSVAHFTTRDYRSRLPAILIKGLQISVKRSARRRLRSIYEKLQVHSERAASNKSITSWHDQFGTKKLPISLYF